MSCYYSNKISILVPCYNASPFLCETLDSILAQTFTNWECIIVNDHSTDDSQEIINIYCAKYPSKFRTYSNKGKGACAARNHAFIESKGDYIQYLDADDLLTPNKLKEQLELLNEFGDKVVISCQWGRFTKNKELVKWEKQLINKEYDHPIDWLTDSWMGNGMAQTAIWLTPRQLIKKAGPWDESLQLNQDGEFFCRVLMNAEKIKFSQHCGVYYRSGLRNSISQAKKQSRGKADSLLRSFKSYEYVLSIKNNFIVRKALGNNYLNFIYQYYKHFPDLTNEAERSFFSLGFNRMWPVGGFTFQAISKVIGFKNTLKLKSYLS